MDSNEQALQVSDVIVFNEAADYFRCCYIFAKITAMSKTGRLTIQIFPKTREENTSTPTYYKQTVSPVISGDNVPRTAILQPKRGKQAGPGYYRWKADGKFYNVLIDLLILQKNIQKKVIIKNTIKNRISPDMYIIFRRNLITMAVVLSILNTTGT